MNQNQEQPSQIVSASGLLKKLFTETLADAEKFDPEVVALTNKHLGVSFPQVKAGNNLAVALIELAMKRADGGQ
jgi:hypothetical protein